MGPITHFIVFGKISDGTNGSLLWMFGEKNFPHAFLILDGEKNFSHAFLILAEEKKTFPMIDEIQNPPDLSCYSGFCD